MAGYAAYWAVTGLALRRPGGQPLPAGRVRRARGHGRLRGRLRGRVLALLTPAGLGVREGVLVVALAPVLPAGPALVVALLSRVWMMLVELAGAGVAWSTAAGPRCKTAGPGGVGQGEGTVATRGHRRSDRARRAG